MKKYTYLFVICLGIAVLLSGCRNSNKESKIIDFVNVQGVSNPDTDLTSIETVEAVFEYLKEGNSYKFNQYICYPFEKDGLTISGYNILFGAHLDIDGEEELRTMMSGLEYEVLESGEEDNRAWVKSSVSNSNSCGEKMTKQIIISLIKKNEIWRVIVDASFKEAVSGGAFTKLFENFNSLCI